MGRLPTHCGHLLQLVLNQNLHCVKPSQKRYCESIRTSIRKTLPTHCGHLLQLVLNQNLYCVKPSQKRYCESIRTSIRKQLPTHCGHLLKLVLNQNLHCVKPSISRFQREVANVVRSIGESIIEEKILYNTGYSVDIVLMNSHTIMEVDGPSHFMKVSDEKFESRGATLLKHRHL